MCHLNELRTDDVTKAKEIITKLGAHFMRQTVKSIIVEPWIFALAVCLTLDMLILVLCVRSETHEYYRSILAPWSQIASQFRLSCCYAQISLQIIIMRPFRHCEWCFWNIHISLVISVYIHWVVAQKYRTFLNQTFVSDDPNYQTIHRDFL